MQENRSPFKVSLDVSKLSGFLLSSLLAIFLSSPEDSSATVPKSGGEGRSGDHKGMGLMLRVQVLKARNLAPKDKSGASDPYLVLTLGDSKEATSAVNKTLNPEWNQTIVLPVSGLQSAIIDGICWDKDRFGKDYMGEFDIAVEDIFARGGIQSEPKWYRLKSKQKSKGSKAE